MREINLSLDEKLKLLTGKDAWHTEDFGGKIPFLTVSDGPHGLRKMYNDNGEIKTVKATAYPCLSMLACSFNTQLAKKVGQYIGDECIENDVDLLLAPGVNIKRTPLCGRNFEYFSEDPYLAGEMGYHYVEGVQSKGIGTSVKHFALNNEENHRFWQNSEADERTMNEIYFPAFERAIEAKPWMVMCSYNAVNGIYASENRKLLSDVLRKKLKFDGVVVSDWCAVRNRAKSLKATLDLEMPDNKSSYEILKKAYEEGFITIEEIDESVNRILDLLEKNENAKKDRKVTSNKEERHLLTKQVAEESIVLLKNNNLLPLQQGKTVCLFNQSKVMCIGGGGSAKIETNYQVPELSNALGSYFNVITRERFDVDITADLNIVCVGTNDIIESECVDRDNISLSLFDIQLIKNVAKANPNNTIVVIYSGSAVDVSEFKDLVSGIIYVGFCGEGATEALSNIICGNVCPSGKLAETFPIKLEDCPIDKKNEEKPAIFYKEGLMVGYRHYDTNEINPQFEFGYGLSYANFDYSNLDIKKIDETNYEVSYTVENTSNVDAKEISQLYILVLLPTPQKKETKRLFIKTYP